ncbi:hypothetical protein KFU94_03305 [Chloroflexi bacterium TSY]|nr:hypothetical protein [Chloroflexi bacterium TSY]
MDEVVTLIRGEIGTKVMLTIHRFSDVLASSESKEENELGFIEKVIPITRAEIRTPSVEWRILNLDEFPDILVEEIEKETSRPTIGYIKHTIFSESSAMEMRTALDELTEAGAEHLILDLRGNPGGLVSSVVEIADLWLDQGLIMVEEKSNGISQIFEATSGTAVDLAIPLVLVVDGGSASASEILAGALRDHGRAILVGEKTFGKGSVQLIRELSDKSSLHITNAVWFTPDGAKIEGRGLQPDIVVEPGEAPLETAIRHILIGDSN